MTNLGRAVMWVVAVLIHIQFWIGFAVTWQPLFPNASAIIYGISMFGVMFGVGPALYIANRVIP